MPVKKTAKRRFCGMIDFLLCLADVLADQVDKAAFRRFSELVIMRRFLAHHEPSTMVAGIEPLGRGAGNSIVAIETNSSAHLDEGAALRKLRRVFVFDANQRGPLIVFEYPDGADGNLVAGLGLADRAPFSSGSDKRHHQDGCERHREYEEGLFQCKFPKHKFAGPTLGHKEVSVNPVVKPDPVRSIVYLRIWTDRFRRGSMEILHSTMFASPVGPLFLAASERGLVALEFDARLPGQQTIRPNPRDLRAEARNLRFEESEQKLSGYVQQLEEYFGAARREFTFPLDMRGTTFQVECWRALVAIPYGETRTYADIARAVGRPQGFRAVGMANNRNPIAIVVPCHRVIASDGTLCGYGGGLDLKRKLLELEGALSGTLAA